nr:hypothetical protein [Ndongobacter massiliensis]
MYYDNRACYGYRRIYAVLKRMESRFLKRSCAS